MQEYLTQENFFSTLFLVSKKPKKINWELVDETKTILGYECKKAIYKETKEIKAKIKNL